MDITTQLKMQEWSQQYADWKSSGLSQKKWCQEQGISDSTFRYRCKRICDEASRLVENNERYKPFGFAEIPNTVIENPPMELPANEREAAIVIQLRNSFIKISNSIADKKLQKVLEVLINAE